MRLTQEEEELLRRYPPATKEALLESQDDETEMETGTPLGYIDPMEGKFNVPEGKTYVAPSLAPREAFKDPADYEATRGFEDVSPAYWKRGGGDLASEERSQRAKIADYEAQKYGDIANKSDLIKEAIEEKRRGELIANVGQGLSTMFRANADALGRGRDDSGYWNALRQQAASGVTDAMESKKAAITDYLTKKRLGSEAISEFEKSRSADYDYERKDPNSDISIAAQRFFVKSFPKYASEDVNSMSAEDIETASKILSSVNYADINARLKEAQIGIEKDKAATAETLAQAKLQGKPPKEMSQEEKALLGAKTDYYKALGLKAGREGTKTVVDPKTGKETTVPTGKITKGQERVDTETAKKITEWRSGGKTNLNASLNVLRNAEKELQDAIDSGRGFDYSGKEAKAKYGASDGLISAPKGLALMDTVQSNALLGLKSVMGAGQISDRDVQNVKDMSFNLMLEPEDNLLRIRRQIQRLEQQAQDNDDLDSYMGSTGGSMSGYSQPKRMDINIPRGYRTPSVPLVTPEAAKITSPTQRPAVNLPKVGEVIDGHEFLGGNPADQKNWRKVGG